MEPHAMTHEENYHFDVAGYLIIRGVLGADELTACNQALDQLDLTAGPLAEQELSSAAILALREHPVLMSYLEQLCGEGVRLDLAPKLIGLTDGQAATPLSSGTEWVDWARAYRQYNDKRFCQGVQVIWALADVATDAGGLVVVPASHNSTVDAPQDLSNRSDDMGLLVQPVLQAGDLLLCAASLMRGLQPWYGNGPQRLITCSYINAAVRPAADSVLTSDDAMPEWTVNLTAVQRAIVHNPNRPYPPQVVYSDGKQTSLAPERGIFHPAIYRHDPDAEIDAKEFYHWDLCGHLVLRGVMDEEWLVAANEAIDANPDRISTGGTETSDSKPLSGAGVGRSSMGDPWMLPGQYGEPFQRMIADPALIQRLNWIMGSGFECMQCSGFLSAKGSSGHPLHAAGEPALVTNHYRQQNGRVYCEYLNVAWQLRDVTLADGGFVCVPGSHKTRYPMPDGIKTCENEMGLVRHVEMKAGDVLLFLASAQTHGAYPWTGEQNRRMIFFQYRSRNLYAP